MSDEWVPPPITTPLPLVSLAKIAIWSFTSSYVAVILTHKLSDQVVSLAGKLIDVPLTTPTLAWVWSEVLSL